MSERTPESSEYPEITVTHQQAINNPDLRLQYRKERAASRKAGFDTFELRNFDVDDHFENGIVLDYYSHRFKRGLIEGNNQDGYFMYLHILEGDEIRVFQLNGEPVENLLLAKVRLKTVVAETDI